MQQAVSDYEALKNALGQGCEFYLTEDFDEPCGDGTLVLNGGIMKYAHPHGFRNLCNALATTANVRIDSLIFSNTNLDSGDVITLTRALKRAKVLKIRILDLSGNDAIDKIGISAIASILDDPNQKIEALYLKGLDMVGATLMPLFGAIESTDHPLKTLDIGNTVFHAWDTKDSIEFERGLLLAIKNTKAPLTQVNLRGTKVSKNLKDEIKMILARRRRTLYGGPPVEPEDLW